MLSRRSLFGIAALSAVCAGLSLGCAGAGLRGAPEPPDLPREFRGVWVATVANIDWPSKKGLSTEEQKAELVEILDTCVETGLNAVVFQVRPECDALYASDLEPWSEWLTGVQGQAPDPYYDPLEFAVSEAHARGLQFHAWFNPYRAKTKQAGECAETHVSKTRPDLVRDYAGYLWLDPGEPEVMDHSTRVIMDVVRRYDIDGVHFDDYFYPYPDDTDFPDDASYERYRGGGGTLERADWRRRNVDNFVRRVYRAIKDEKPRVMFGLSPFGIWRPGNPEGIQGFDAYNSLYADSKYWLNQGWVDYYTPQLYWPINQKAQSFTALLDWWVKENLRQRHLWPGLGTYRIRGSNPNPVQEYLDQVTERRSRPGYPGHVHFSMKYFVADTDGVATAFSEGPYRTPAVIPPTVWLDRKPPKAPIVDAVPRSDGSVRVIWESRGSEPAFQWAAWAWDGSDWAWRVLPAGARECDFPAGPGGPATLVGVSAIDRMGNESRRRFTPVEGP